MFSSGFEDYDQHSYIVIGQTHVTASERKKEFIGLLRMMLKNIVFSSPCGAVSSYDRFRQYISLFFKGGGGEF